MATLRKLVDRGVIKEPPHNILGGLQYEAIMGSKAYGVSTDDSDWDIYGFTIPEKRFIFPHTAGEIPMFGTQIQRFEQYQNHHVKFIDTKTKEEREYDFTIYNITKYFQLAMENNPNMLDSLFVPQHCVLLCSNIAQQVRQHRKIFLHKGCWHKLKGYAYSQLHKLKNKEAPESLKRQDSIAKFGFDVKFGYHIVRLLLEAEQILTTGDLILNRDAELLKAIRQGEWSLERIQEFFSEKERSLEEVYNNSTAVPYKPNEELIKELLLNCLEEHFGSLNGMVEVEGKAEQTIRQIQEIITKNGY